MCQEEAAAEAAELQALMWPQGKLSSAVIGQSATVIAQRAGWPEIAALEPRVLLVDDLADSGHTLNAVIHQLRTNYQPISELRSAVIWTKALSTFTPDYSVEYLATNPWIHQPFESYDALRPEQLIQKWSV